MLPLLHLYTLLPPTASAQSLPVLWGHPEPGVQEDVGTNSQLANQLE